MQLFRKNFYKKGFTLLEIMMVIAVIGILSATVYPQVTGQIARTRDADRIADIKAIGVGLKNYFNDINQYPSSDGGCMNETLLKGYVPVDAFRSPGGHNYNEGCGPNGRYAYGTNSMKTLYILSSNMESAKSGNYNQSKTLSDMISQTDFDTINKNLSEKSGKYYIASAGYYIDEIRSPGEIVATGGGTYTPTFSSAPVVPTPPANPTPPPVVPTPPIVVPKNCVAGRHGGYDVPILNHLASKEVSYTIPGRIIRKRWFPDYRTPNRIYTANATCNNGDITIHDERFSDFCSSGYHISGNQCIRNIQTCTIENGTGQKVWNETTKTYGECEVKSCDEGFQQSADSKTCESVCHNPIFLHENGVTIKARDCAEVNKEYNFNGKQYYITPNDLHVLKEKIDSGYPTNQIVTSRLNNLNFLFKGDFMFNGDISNWDVSNVSSMYALFDGATNFNGDLSKWDTSKVSRMFQMFKGATSFNSDLSKWNVSAVTDMLEMFYGNKVFDSDLSGWSLHSDVCEWLFGGKMTQERRPKFTKTCQ